MAGDERAYLQVDPALVASPKIFELAVALGIPEVHAAGHLVALWSWAFGRSPDGRLASPAVAARAAQWPGDARAFWDALLAGRWLEPHADGGAAIHDWLDHQGRALALQAAHDIARLHKHFLRVDAACLPAARARDRDRCRCCGVAVNYADRRGAAGGSYARLDPAVGGALDNVVVACRACVETLACRAPADAGLAVLPPPADPLKRAGLAAQALAILERTPGWGAPSPGDLPWLDGVLDRLLAAAPQADPIWQAEQIRDRAHVERNRRGLVEYAFRHAAADAGRDRAAGPIPLKRGTRDDATGPRRGAQPAPRTPITDDYVPFIPEHARR